jgi:Uma2 family endonuclease
MGAAALRLPNFITVQEYLDGELHSEVRHDYRDGKVYAMAGASREHERVSMNVATELSIHLDGKPCRPYKSDFKIRLRINDKDVFFYPDILVTCDPEDNHRYYSERPKVIIEVLFEDENRDLVEKFLFYQTIASLEEYIVLSQDPNAPLAHVFRRAHGWRHETVPADGVLEIPSLEFRVDLRRLYRGM